MLDIKVKICLPTTSNIVNEYQKIADSYGLSRSFVMNHALKQYLKYYHENEKHERKSQ